MKSTDFQPEHFEKGRSFNKSDFIAYREASDNLVRTMYTKYLLSVGVGLLFSFLFSRAVGGFVGNILALVCIFSGLIVGGIFIKTDGADYSDCQAEKEMAGRAFILEDLKWVDAG